MARYPPHPTPTTLTPLCKTNPLVLLIVHPPPHPTHTHAHTQKPGTLLCTEQLAKNPQDLQYNLLISVQNISMSFSVKLTSFSPLHTLETIYTQLRWEQDLRDLHETSKTSATGTN